MNTGDHIYINPHTLVPGMRLSVQAPGFGFGEIEGPIDLIARSSGDFLLAVAPPQGNTTKTYPMPLMCGSTRTHADPDAQQLELCRLSEQ